MNIMNISNIDQIRDYLTSVQSFADRVGLRASLDKALDRLGGQFFGHPTRVRLFKDFAPQSFEFVKEYQSESGKWEFAYNGGVIYHGPHDNGGDGSAPTFSVNLERHHGWSIHT
jgi:hypothetical protein